MVMDVFQELTQNKVDGIVVDGCSAPNPAMPLSSLAKTMAWFSTHIIEMIVLAKRP